MPKVFVVGIGPGNMEHMTPKAKNAIEGAEIIIGYNAYIDLIKHYFPNKTFIYSCMTKEVERCRLVLEKACEGYNVALVSSGDSGIYGMAGIMLEVANKSGNEVEVEVIPGITAANAAAAVLGAPLMHDFAVISLSDLLTPWDLICKRVECAADGDFVISLYNPKSKGRSEYIGIVRDIVLRYRKESTPVGIVMNAGRENEKVQLATLGTMLEYEIDMFTTVIIGNSNTYTGNGKMITPRGYRL